MTVPIINPLVSIITVVFNGEKYLAQTIQSVIKQTYANIEYIVIDGGSTDGTIDIIHQNQDNINFWVSEKDNGLADAMNKGVGYASGDLVMHLHADDQLISSDTIDELVKTLTASTNQWITAFYLFVNSENEIIKRDKMKQYSFNDMLLRNIIRHQTTLVPRSIFFKITFDKQYQYAMDYDFFLNVWRRLGAPKAMLCYVAKFRLDGQNLSSDYYASIKDEMKARKNYRKQMKQMHVLPFDYIVYWLRILKIVLYHARRRRGVR